MSTAKKVLLILLAVLVLIAAIAIIYVYTMLGRIKRVSLDEAAEIAQSALSASPLPEDEPMLEDDALNLEEEVGQSALSEEEQAALEDEQKRQNVINILLIGVDRRGSSGYSRSDTMLIATVDKNNNKLKLTSLMRDLYLPIPGVGENRINKANSSGGPGLLIDTINQNFSLDLTEYVLVDFDMFEEIVDALGGVTIEMSRGEVQECNDCIAGLNVQRGDDRNAGLITAQSGSIHLTGKQALGYCRIRKFGYGDFSRTSRQFKVLRAIYDKFMQVGVGQKLDVINKLLPYIETNMTNGRIIELATTVIGMGVDSSSLLHYRLPVEGYYKPTTIRGMSVLLPDIPANALKLHEFIYEATEVEALEGSDTGRGTYHPKNTPTPSPSLSPSPSLDPSLSPWLPELSPDPSDELPGLETPLPGGTVTAPTESEQPDIIVLPDPTPDLDDPDLVPEEGDPGDGGVDIVEEGEESDILLD